MIKHLQCDEASKDSIYISDDYVVWGSSDSINRLSDHLDDLDSQIESLKASELAHRLLYERTKEQNTLLVEALEGLKTAMFKSIFPGASMNSDEDRIASIPARDLRSAFQNAESALAAVKEAK